MAARGSVELPEGVQAGLDAELVYDPPNLTFPFGAYICVVDIDPGTGKVKVRRFVAVDDCGTRINPMIIEGQVHGGLTDGVGIALMEMIAFDEEGNCLSGSLMDYLIPTAVEVPDWETDFTVTPSPHHPIGAKGIGESATVGSPPTIVNAIVDALAPHGVRHLDMPCTPARVWEAMRLRCGGAAMSRPFVTGLVLAAGGSERLGRPKQLLRYGSATLLDHVLSTARACEFDQLLCALGGGVAAVRAVVDLDGVTVVENHHFGEGCSSSIAAALNAVDPRAELLVLMLGDQPGVSSATVTTLISGRGNAPLAACGYEDGRGHPLAFARPTFGELATLHGDKGVWKLLDRYGAEVVDVPVRGPIPRDVDTWEDYRIVLAEAGVA